VVVAEEEAAEEPAQVVEELAAVAKIEEPAAIQ
jgi:hypothetical protein